MSDGFLDQLESNLIAKKVSITEFAEDSKFCNKTLYPKQRLLLKLIFLEDRTDYEETLLDDWIASKEVRIAADIRERVDWCRSHNYKHFREIVLVGGRRSSKGFLTGLALGKKMYDTLQLQDPNQHYGIDANKEIYFTCVAASEKQAKELQYADLSSTVNSCHVMQPYIHKVQELEFSLNTEADKRRLEEWKRQRRRVQRDISKLRGRALASNARTIRGYTSMGIVFDEFAHFMQGESDAADDAVYEAAIPSLAQFGQDGMLFCNSSPYTKVGKMYERFEVSQAQEDGHALSPVTFGIQFPSWAMFEGWWQDASYRGPKKCITVSPDWDPEDTSLYNQEDRNSIVVERNIERDNPDKYKVERRARWAEVVDSYLDPDMVDRMFMGRPIGREQFEPYATNWNDSSYVYRYKAHLDPSSTTAGFGFALGHTEVFKLEDENGVLVENEHVVFDIVKRWHPSDFPGNVIDWAYVIREVVTLADLFRPYEITFDQFQSAAPIQELRRTLLGRGIDCRVFEKTATAQHNWNRAEVFKTALYQGLVHVPNNTPDVKYSGEELKYLQEIKTGRIPRVEKQDVGPVQTKDMADCIMEVVEGLIGNVIARQQRQDLALPPSFGAQGGYPLGGLDRGGEGTLPPALADLYSHRRESRYKEERVPGVNDQVWVEDQAEDAPVALRVEVASGNKCLQRNSKQLG
jgi:hypothetical protein